MDSFAEKLMYITPVSLAKSGPGGGGGAERRVFDVCSVTPQVGVFLWTAVSRCSLSGRPGWIVADYAGSAAGPAFLSAAVPPRAALHTDGDAQPQAGGTSAQLIHADRVARLTAKVDAVVSESGLDVGERDS